MALICDYIFLFFVFSMLGWCMEVTLKYRQYGRFINRGFFIGPILPIYGSGAVCLTALVDAFAAYDSSVGTTFLISFFTCGIIEYLASWYMEKRYHARWWDYSKKPMNLNGRVWIGNLILFGLGGLAIYYVADPFIFEHFHYWSLLTREIICFVMVAVFAADFVMSMIIMKVVKVGVESSEADNTEEISKEVRMLLNNKNILYKRLANAYPEVTYRTEKVKARLEAIKKESERLQAIAEQHIDEASAEFEKRSKDMVPATVIKSRIIEEQDQLIQLLKNGQKDDDLEKEISRNKDILKKRMILPLKESESH